MAPSHLVIAGVGHVGLALAHDGITGGFQVTCLGPALDRTARLIGALAVDDPTASVLQAALVAGRLRLSDGEASSCVGFDVAVLTPDGRSADPLGRGPVEAGAAALAPQLRRGALVVLAGQVGMRACGELVAATFELLTGLRAGLDYGLGYGIAHPATASDASPGPTITSGNDPTSADRTDAFFRGLGRTTAGVTPVEAAELVARLLHSVGRGGSRERSPSGGA